MNAKILNIKSNADVDAKEEEMEMEQQTIDDE